MNVAETQSSHSLAPAAAAPLTMRLPRGAVLGLLLMTSIGTGVVLSIFGPTVPAMAARLRVPPAALGLVFTTTFLAATLTTTATGALFSRIGGRVLIPTGLAAMALGLLLEGTAGTLGLVALGGMVAGLGTGINNVSVNIVTARLYPERSNSVLTWLNVCFGVGAFFTPLAASLALAYRGTYAPTYLLGAAILALPILPLLWGLPATSSATTPAPQMTAARALLRDRNLRLLMLLAGLYLGTEIGFGGWIISIAAATTHAPPAQLAPAASAFWICLALGGAPTVLLLRRGVAPRHLMIGGALAAAATALLLLLLSRSVPLTIACCALMGLVIAPILPQTTATAARQGARDASDSLRVAALFTVGQIGAAALPALQGVLLGVGPTPALLLTVVGATAMALLAYAVAPSESIP